MAEQTLNNPPWVFALTRGRFARSRKRIVFAFTMNMNAFPTYIDPAKAAVVHTHTQAHTHTHTHTERETEREDRRPHSHANTHRHTNTQARITSACTRTHHTQPTHTRPAYTAPALFVCIFMTPIQRVLQMLVRLSRLIVCVCVCVCARARARA